VKRRTALPLLGAAIVGVLLTGCVPEPGPAAPSGSAPSSPSAVPSPTASPTASPVADACLIGAWTADQGSLAGFYNDVAAVSGGDVSFAPEGTAALTLRPDETYTWSPAAVIVATTSGMETRVDLSGSLSGTYRVDADTITVRDQDRDGLLVEATVNGEPVDPSSIAPHIVNAPIDGAHVSCDGDVLVLTTPFGAGDAEGTATITMHRE